MYKDPSEFRERFKAYKEGKSVRDIYRLPGYAGGKATPLDDTLEFLKQYEGFKDTTYLYGNGIPTIGYGFTDSSLVNKGKITRAEADDRLRQEVLKRESVLSRMKNWDKLSEESKTALRSYYYNYPAGFKDTTKFMKYWNSGQYSKAIKEIDAGMYDKKNSGLRTRRLAEQALLRNDPFLMQRSSIVSEKPKDVTIQYPDAVRVATTIPQEKVITYTDHRNTVAAETDRSIWAHKVMNDIQGMAYRTPIWKSRPYDIKQYGVTRLQPTGFKNGKLPRYKIGKNPSHAKMNDDGTFTDDYTKVFEDMYITPEKVDLKRGSHTLNNFPEYLANRTAWMQTFVPQSVLNDKPLERVYPEFDLLLGGRQITNELLPLKSSINREQINYNKIREQIAKMKSDDDAFRAAHPEYEIENILQKPKLEDASVIDELVKRTNLEDRSYKGIFEKILYENKDLHGKQIVNLHNNRARLSGDFIDNVGQVFDVDTPEGYENAIQFLEKYYFGTRDGAERLLKDPDFQSHLKGFSIPRGSRPVFISKSKLIQRQEQDLGRKLTQQEADDLYYKTISHERHHSFDKIHNTPEGFNLEGLSPDDYFVKDGFDELAARGTQLKNMFGLYKNPLTAAHLRYASSQYFKDPSNINNNMTRFFNMISDYDKAAKWLQENATGILPFAIGGSVVASMPEYKDGKIAIKPANRGKFNATKKRTGKTTEELTHSKNPITRKRAIFAQNAKKWKH